MAGLAALTKVKLSSTTEVLQVFHQPLDMRRSYPCGEILLGLSTEPVESMEAVESMEPVELESRANGGSRPHCPGLKLRLGPVDIHRRQIMAPTRNSMDANESAVFS